jgi:flagella basal body P-ring formation protein FlgA
MTPLAILALASACLPLPPSSEAITAGDLVPSWPALRAIAAETALGLAPAPGVERIFRASDLQRIAARFQIPDIPAAPICIHRPVAPIDPERMLEAMHKAIPGARIEILESSRYRAPAGEIVFERSALRRNGMWPGHIVYGRARRFAIWARVQASVTMTRVVATEPLRAGLPIAAAQVSLQTAAAAPGDYAAAQSLDQVIGRIPVRTVAAGAPIARNLLAEPDDIHRGDTVQVEVQRGAARLELQAQAEANGRVGQRISLRNPESGRRFQARVAGKGKVTIP